MLPADHAPESVSASIASCCHSFTSDRPTGIAVEWAVSCMGGEERHDSTASGLMHNHKSSGADQRDDKRTDQDQPAMVSAHLQAPCRRPLLLQDVQTDLARLTTQMMTRGPHQCSPFAMGHQVRSTYIEMDVRVEDLGDELDVGWPDRVLGPHLDLQLENPCTQSTSLA